MKFRYFLMAIVFAASTAAIAADEETITGVVTNVNTEQQTITIRSDRSGRRHTYHLSSDTRLSSQGNAISLGNVQRGNSVTLRFSPTDSGRELMSLRLPDPADIREIVPVEFTEVQTITGVIAGVRPTSRTVTIREDGTRQRRTLNIPKDTPITRNGREVPLRALRAGDNFAGRYRVTERGLMLVTGKAPEVAPAPRPAPVASASPAPMMELPKTASNVFGYLLLSLGLLSAAAFVRIYRKQSGR